MSPKTLDKVVDLNNSTATEATAALPLSVFALVENSTRTRANLVGLSAGWGECEISEVYIRTHTRRLESSCRRVHKGATCTLDTATTTMVSQLAVSRSPCVQCTESWNAQASQNKERERIEPFTSRPTVDSASGLTQVASLQKGYTGLTPSGRKRTFSLPRVTNCSTVGCNKGQLNEPKTKWAKSWINSLSTTAAVETRRFSFALFLNWIDQSCPCLCIKRD